MAQTSRSHPKSQHFTHCRDDRHLIYCYATRNHIGFVWPWRPTPWPWIFNLYRWTLNVLVLNLSWRVCQTGSLSNKPITPPRKEPSRSMVIDPLNPLLQTRPDILEPWRCNKGVNNKKEVLRSMVIDIGPALMKAKETVNEGSRRVSSSPGVERASSKLEGP